MKSNYIRTFLLAVIVLIFFSLNSRWQAMFSSTSHLHNPKVVGDQPRREESSHKPVISNHLEFSSRKDYGAIPDNYGHSHFKPIILNTKVFKNLTISPVNGSITNVELVKYKASLDNRSPMSLLSDNRDLPYIAEAMIVIDGKKQPVVFTNTSVKKTTDQTIITLIGRVSDVIIKRDYHIHDNTYTITINQSIRNKTGKSISVSFDNSITRGVISGNRRFNLLDVHSYSFTGVGLSSTQKYFQKEKFKNITFTSPIEVPTRTGWIAMIQHYFVSLWIPNNPDLSYKVYAHKLDKNTYQAGIKTIPVVLNEGKSLQNNNTFYAGPTITKNIEAIVKNFSKMTKPLGLDKLVDYGLLSFISVIIFGLMTFIHSALANWGLSIIIVTLLIKILFYPLSAKSYRSMAKMRTLQPRMKELQHIHKGDRQTLGRKTMELYKRESVNPASGCLPVIIQIPVFIALYWVILESVQLRQAPFIFWIDDLASRDKYFVLPILMGISMLIQQKVSATSTDPTQEKIMMLMPVIFTIFFISFPSGLVLYWLTNNCVSILQQWYVTRKYTR
jgi:YidC/Oxa1 family membrane protein insertase